VRAASLQLLLSAHCVKKQAAFRCGTVGGITGCYIDESGTDSNLPIAVVAGLLLDGKGFFWLGQEWDKILERHKITGPIHMREFGPDGRFKDLSHDDRRTLFGDLVKAINEHKLMSTAGTLTSDLYRQTFRGVTKLSMYAACFCNVAMVCGIGLEKRGQHRWPLAFTLDKGNNYKAQIIESKPVIMKTFPRVSRICFDSDDNVVALQAADVLSWAVRRDLSGTFAHGFEPLKDLFDLQHLNVEYKEEWMKGVAEKIKRAESVDVSPGQSQ
jgi:Protein of unknown function (DUF3800)